MSLRWLFAGVGVLAALAGTALWLGTRAAPHPDPRTVNPAALFAASFSDTRNVPQNLGRFIGTPLVVNFWATWCGPCREEMPAFARLQHRWQGRVQFVGLSSDEPSKVERFAAETGVDYPLWVGDDAVGDLARRLGNSSGVLPYTVLVDASGAVAEAKAGAYTETELDRALQRISPKRE